MTRRKTIMATNRYITLAVLVFIHIVTYMDRYTLAGVLTLTEDYFQIDNGSIGLVQTVFVISLTVLSPLFGYLGDRFNRRYIMAFGVTLAAGVTLAGSFVDKKDFWLFITSRTLVGIGEASFSTVAPTMITDQYVEGQRSLALAIFYLCMPVGSGLGYIIGSNVAHVAGDQWQWAFRVTPGLGLIGALLVLTVLGNPMRGEAEGYMSRETTSWVTDLKEIFKVRSCMWTYGAGALVTYSAGAVAFWFPTMVYKAYIARGVEADMTSISLIFGIFTCVAGVVGVLAGAEIVRRYRVYNPRSDAIVTGTLMLLSAPFLYAAIFLAGRYSILMWGLFFVSEVLMCSNFSVQTDMILSVVAPTRRATADALMVITSHLFGDASSPYIVGAISDRIAKHMSITISSSDMVDYLSLQYSLYSLCFVAVLAGGAFIMAGITLEKDRAKIIALCQGYGKLNAPINDELEDLNHPGQRQDEYTVSPDTPVISPDEDQGHFNSSDPMEHK